MKTRTIEFYLVHKAQLWCYFEKAFILQNTVKHVNGGVAIIEVPSPSTLYVRCMSDHVTVMLDLDVTLAMEIKVAVTEAHCHMRYWDTAVQPPQMTTVPLSKTDPWSTLIQHYLQLQLLT